MSLTGAAGYAIPCVEFPDERREPFRRGLSKNCVKRLLFLGAGIVLVFVGMGMVLPALAMARNFGELPLRGVTPLIIGVALCSFGLASLIGGCLPRLVKK